MANPPQTKPYLRILLTYFLTFILFSLIYIALFHTAFFSFEKVLFYRGLMLLAVTVLTALMVVVITLRFNKRLLNYLETMIAAIVITAALHLSFFVVFPVTFERSVTMYLLNTLAQNQTAYSCPGLSKSQLEQKLILEYIIANRALDKRLAEQKEIDFISEKGECIQIAPKTNQFLRFSAFIKALYGLP
ncbi:hypothetical protein A3F03_02840 [Candidatus Roizmanbacteria bacterium RIFCSPHIGHO2_12_FULL_41_11]|uniref:Uncharacterized protein n=3 Tax=Candidatus Roizmaniibacteriota TaxID=1752723 RepID=A0A1F7JQL7_9BACT|nr:MAG: hypothetical protein A3F03_02840 [Candidatus Roizmanbacteria bacterium RIFCSPHIGHO2_12_FULL_41_11]OGK51843.1 MAG: hypothetical protein A2966_00490 [Candidatus Roizmanbacteria bacterium RIFCSPLOWO2_01_FULL_41_22]OGK57891.1 MAG: hypothetical protein A3H86_01095 [Candidatus Roizmanbacteria bacterium RIFCSPLOWO2_02_FULL_41_9]